MGDSPGTREALPLLGEVYRRRLAGVLSIELEEPPLGLVIRDGDVVGFVSSPEPERTEEDPPDPAPSPPASETPSVPPDLLPEPEDSARLKLDRVLAEVGLRGRGKARGREVAPSKQEAPPKTTAPAKVTSTDAGELRDRLVAALAAPGTTASFEETDDAPPGLVSTASPVEPLILEAVQRLDAEQVSQLLGNVDRRLVATSALSEQQRTLTLPEGYLISRVDGQCSAREILQLVPGRPGEAEATLAGLLLTGRLAMEEAAPQKARPARPATGPEEEPKAPDEKPNGEKEPASEAKPEAPEPTPPSPGAPVSAGPPPREMTGEATSEQTAERNQILELYQSLPLRNHYEVLGVARTAPEAEIKAAHVALIKRYHPDMRREPYLEDLHDVLEAIFIRVGEAWEVLGNAKNRARYEQELGRSSKARTSEGTKEDERPPPEEILAQARFLVGKKSFGDAIAMLERALPHIESREHRHSAHILRALAYSHLAATYSGAEAKKWVNHAREILQDVLAEDGRNANALYELGMVYKRHGMTARAQAMFRKALEADPSHSRAAAALSPTEEPREKERGLLRRLFGGGNNTA